MKISILTILALVASLGSFAQNKAYYVDDDYVLGGYDAVSYFSGTPKKGKTSFTHKHDGVTFRFASQANLDLFKGNPAKYSPQYGGWCSYAVATGNKKVKSDPETFEIRDGKLYLFYNFFFTNTLDDWIEEDPSTLIVKADKNWGALRSK